MAVSASQRSADLVVRAATARDDAAIGRLFDETLSLGDPLDFRLTRAAAYRDQCLGWYLTAGRADVGVVVDPDDPDDVVGYALVCTDEVAYGKAMRFRSLWFIAVTFGHLLTFRMNAPSRRFYADRARDAFALVDAHRTRPAPAHAHLNVRRGRRSGAAALLLRDHIDDRCRRVGIATWSGDINARAGQRRRALERLGLAVVSSHRNHTLSRRFGVEVDRFMVLRHVPVDTVDEIRH